MMSSPFTQFFDFTIPNALHLAGILVLALLCIRLLRAASNKLIKPASTQSKGAQQREQQTRALADKIHGVGCRIIWVVAALTALPEFGISALPGVVIAGAAILGFSIGARDTIRDAIAGLQIMMEEQFAAGDTIQAGDTAGRVEQLTLRRTVVRDGRGALVSLSNGEMRSVSNLSRDWSQAFVDIGVAAETPLEKTLQALESAAAGLRGDAAWSQALVDGPRVLGVQEYDHAGATLRLQVRTAPTRQDEVCRELRRRIHIEFRRQGIALNEGKPAAGAGAALT
ncbi:MAG TPA: mechanosensitive ion channel family protein [Candidatus Saccharimonadales bacterium]|nr:mechanosensitive ion channel family protein [Candidatus Saccharimonadales bacterium]